MYQVVFVYPDLSEIVVDANGGESILEVAEKHHIALKGACGGNLACASCHVIIDEKWFDIVDDACSPSEREEDLLELAPGLVPNSRLACQIKMCEALNGIRIIIPERNRNL